MFAQRSQPWPGVALALIGAAGIVFSGASLWLAVAIGLLWIGSLFIFRTEAEVPVETIESRGGGDTARRAVLEPIGTPLLIVQNNRISVANKAARTALGDHVPGQDPRIALRHPDAMRLLEMEDGDSVTISGFKGGRSVWQLTRRTIDARRTLIELEDRTAEADMSRAHTDFVANASHELRTPLSAIIGYVETLTEEGQTVDQATAARFHETVLREARRMQTLVSDLMSLSQAEAEKHELPADRIDLARVTERAVGEVVAIAGKHRVDLSVQAEDVQVRGDRSQLEQLVRNLVDNALKYGDGETPVEVSLTTDGKRAVLTVKDRGAGIAPEHLPHLTRRFYRTDPGRSRAAGGTGLGLAIVKHITERHRGRLDIASTVGIGTTVTATLPVEAD